LRFPRNNPKIPFDDRFVLEENNTTVKRFAGLFQFICALVIFFAIPLSSAEAAWVGRGSGTDLDASEKSNVMSNFPYLFNMNIWQVTSLYCQIYMIKGPDNCTNDSLVQAEWNKKTALGNVNSAIASIYGNPPANLALWVRDTGQTLGFIPHQAYAQGVGFTGLAPLLPIWKAFRNIAYVLLALSLVIVGFMVMLRKRIDPKTVVTVQNSLPRIVIALILITFSYAIVGLMIDIMYLLIGFITIVMRANMPNAWEGIGKINYASGGFFDLMFAIFSPMFTWNPLTQTYFDVVNQNWPELAADLFEGTIGTIVTGGPLFILVLLIAYLFAFIRILFLLLSSYIQIILAVLTGPLQILTDVFPGANGFTEWVKNIAANLMVFPITVFMLMLGNAITQQFVSEGSLWVPPLLPQGVGLGGLAQTLISLGIVLTIPNIANSLKEALKAKSAVPSGMDVIGGQMKTAFPLALQVGGMWWQHKSLSQALAPIDKGTGGALGLSGKHHEE
jgi:hypothetical protein